MKKMRLFLVYCVVLVFLALNKPVWAQFENRDDIWRTFGPGDSKVPIGSLWADPNKPTFVFAESNGALYRSIDAGVFWSRIKTPLNEKVQKLLAANGRLFVAIADNGLFYTRVDGKVSPDGAIDWAQVLNNETITKLIEHNGILYAGTDSAGVFYSTDGGNNWTQTNAPMIDKSVDEIVTLGNTLYAMTNTSTGLFKSTDAGVNWTAVTLPTDGELLASANGMLFIGNHARDMDTRGIWRSTDGGKTWTQTYGPGLNTNVFRGLVAAGNKLFAWALFPELDDRATFLVSDNDGESWTDGALSKVTAIISLNGIIIAGTAKEGIFLSYDKGETWVSANSPLDAATGKRVVSLRVVDKTLYASVLDKIPPRGLFPGGVYISTDNGRNWSPSSQGLAQNNAIFDMEVDLGFVLALSTTGGIPNEIQLFRSTDFGFNWLDISQSIDRSYLAYDSTFPPKLYARLGTLFLSMRGVIFYSRNSGVKWAPTDCCGGHQLFSLISADGVLYGRTSPGNSIFRSEDGGINWTSLPISEEVLDLLFNDGTLYAGTSGNGLFFSTDRGASWTPANAPFNTGNISPLVATDNTIVAGTDAGVFYSMDSGRNWARANAPMHDKSVSTFVFANGTLYAGTTASGAFFSENGGADWTQAEAPMHDKNVAALITVVDRIYARTNDGVFWTFADNGRKWFPLKTGMENINIKDLDYLPVSNRLYAATDNGVYLQTLDMTAPIANSFFINNGAEFAKSDTVKIFFSVDNADSMIISENPAFSDTVWQTYRSEKFFKLSTAADGAKTVHAKFKDLSSNESATLSAQIILDRNNPDFSKFPHTPPSAATPGRAIRITQQVDENNLDNFDLFFRRVGETWDRNARKIGFVNNTAVIDSERVNNRGLDYQIIATDKAGRNSTLQNGSLDFFSLPVNVGATALGNSRSLPSGTGGAAYRIVSIPLDLPNAPQVKNVFKNLGKYGRRGKWRFYSYSGNGQWQEGENISMQTGAGYFIIRRDGDFLTNAISGTTTKTTDGVLGNISGWRLRAGDWTLIGNPYNTRIELNQLKLKRKGTLLSNHGVDVQVWSYDGQWKNLNMDPELALEIWGGLFVRVANADTIVFADTKEPYARSARKAGIVAANLAAGEWSVQITAASSEFSDEVNYFGVKKEAKNDLDNLDWYEPPFLSDGVGLSFPHAEWNDPTELTADFRSHVGDGHRWEITVKGEPTYAVQLSFANIETMPKDLQVLLVDETTKIVRDLRKEPALAIRIPESGAKSLTIIAGNDFFINKHTEGMLGLPTTFALHPNYPNPFNPSTTIRYQLPVAGRVTLKIFDIMGREVMALEENKSREPGYYEMVADMSALGSGVYFYRIAVAGEQKFQATKKMLFVK